MFSSLLSNIANKLLNWTIKYISLIRKYLNNWIKKWLLFGYNFTKVLKLNYNYK